MKSFVLFSSREEPHSITEKEFEKWTKGEFPFVQKDSEKTRYYATCPECENPIQIRGLYGNSKKYGAHAGKDVDGLNPFNYENYIYCPRSVQGRRIPKETRKKTTSPKDITIYNVIQMCRKTPSFSYGDIRHVHQIYANPTRSHQAIY